jgi:hypothetical protein
MNYKEGEMFVGISVSRFLPLPIIALSFFPK